MQNKVWDLRQLLLSEIQLQGGWVNCHTHLDRAYTITSISLNLATAHLHEKWLLVDEIKRNSTVDQIYDRMAFALEQQINQGVTCLGSFIDVDSVAKDKTLRAASRIKETFKDKNVSLKFINQTLKGVIKPDSYQWFKLGAEFVDIIGGLPGADKGKEAEHIDIVLETARSMGKIAHIHVDQLNTQKETETELLAKKTIDFKMHNKVVAIHSVSLAAHPMAYRKKTYALMKKAGLQVITCPTAWIDSRRSEETTPTHNAIAPVEELVENKVTVGLGTDNIADIYKPFTDGDMWTELRFLLESCHFYQLESLIQISTRNGREILGLK